MILFLLFSIPLFYISFSLLYHYKEGRIKFYFIDFFKGILWFFPVLLIYLFFKGFFQLSYKPFFQYMYYFNRDHFLQIIFVLSGYILLYYIRQPHNTKSRFIEVFSFLSGYYTLNCIQYFLTYINDLDLYILFTLPIIRLFTILTLSFLLDKFLEAFQTTKIFYGIIMFLVPVLSGFITIFHMRGLSLLSLFLSLGLFGGAFTAYYFLKDT